MMREGESRISHANHFHIQRLEFASLASKAQSHIT
jgi:hypothetical protein